MRFDQLYYSVINFNFHFQNLDRELSFLKNFLKKNHIKARSAIDVGCGDGYITARLKKILNLQEMYGLDLNKKLLEKAAHRNIQTIHGDMNVIRPNKTFNLVISYGSVHHAQDTLTLMRQLKKLSGRHILIADNTVRKTFFHKLTGSKYFPLESSSCPIRTLEEIIEALRKARCKIIDIETNRNANIWHDRSFVLASVK